MPRSVDRSIRLLLLILPSALAGQSGAPADTLPAVEASGAFFALSVADLPTAAAWYQRVFGLRVVLDQSRPGAGQPAVVALEGGGLVVELVHRGDAKPPEQLAPAPRDRAGVLGPFKVGLVVRDFDRALATLRRRGAMVAFGPYPAHDGQRPNVILRDAEGNLIQLFGSVH